MKKLIPIFMAFLSVVVLITGCNKDGTEPVVNPPATLIFELNPNKDIIKKGEDVKFTWTSNADSCIVTLSSGEKYKFGSNGTRSFFPNQSTNFVWAFFLKKITKTKNVPIYIEETILPPTITLSASPDHTLPGGSVMINFSATDADSVSSPNFVNIQGVSGSISTPPLQLSTSFSFSAWGRGGVKTDSIRIVVDPPLPPTKTDFLVLDSWSDDTVWYKQQESDPWEFLVESNQWWTVYRRDGTVDIYEPPNTVISNGSWSWSTNEEYLISGYTNTVVRLDSTTMILKRLENCSYCPSGYMIVMRKYIHKYK